MLSFILDTDASQVGLGAALSQVQEDGCEQVIAYASNYYICAQFLSLSFGNKVLLQTVHGSLTWLQKFKQLEGQLVDNTVTGV